jgi:glycosyltransferase involved in cell wall biosynthesis
VEPYIKECLESIVNSTLKDIEIIVVNDCSPANEDAIIQKFAEKDKRIKYIKLDKNVGLGEARNIGFSQATGEYFYCVDSDDYIDETLLEKAYNKAKQLNADMLFFPLTMVDCATNEKIPSVITDKRILKFENESFTHFEVDSFFFDFYTGAQLRIYKKEFYKKYISYPKSVKHEDVVMSFVGWLKSDRIAFINEPLYYYRINRPGSITYQSVANVKDIEIYLEGVIKLFKEQKLFSHYKYRLIPFLVQAMHWYKLNKDLYYFIKRILKQEINSYNEIKKMLSFKKGIRRILFYPFWLYKLIYKK